MIKHQPLIIGEAKIHCWLPSHASTQYRKGIREKSLSHVCPNQNKTTIRIISTHPIRCLTHPAKKHSTWWYDHRLGVLGPMHKLRCPCIVRGASPVPKWCTCAFSSFGGISVSSFGGIHHLGKIVSWVLQYTKKVNYQSFIRMVI